MSLFGAMNSGVSGLASQSSAMAAISDNITNVNTVGYKSTKVDFQTLVTKQGSSSPHSSGGVQSRPRAGVDVQGLLQASSSSTGSGQFPVTAFSWSIRAASPAHPTSIYSAAPDPSTPMTWAI